MSGDVQPRKRKDKKKRKDGEDEHHAAPRSSVSLSDNDDVNIHVHKDGGTGGGICAKFVFFVLLTALAVLIGLIVTEHRGLTHLDTIEKESRFSQLFEGWVDTAPEDHGDHEVPDLHDENELDHDDDHDEEHDDEHDDDHDDDHDEDHEDDDHDEDHDDEEESEEADIKEDDEVEDHEEGSEQVAQSEELDHADATDEEEAAEDQPDEVENEDDNDDEADKDESAQEETIPESNEDNEPKSEELNISEEERQEKEEGASPENADDVDQENDDPDAKDDDAGENSENEELSIGDRSSNYCEEEKLDTQDLSRRNTIVVPPKVEEVVQQVIEQKDEDLSDGEQVDEEEIILHPKVTAEYQSLRTTYERSLTPESELEDKNYDYDEEDQQEEVEEEEEEIEDIDDEYMYEEEGADLGEDQEELDEEEEDEIGYEVEIELEYDDEEDEVEEIEEEEEPVSDDDDELMKKLEAKYGRLSTSEQQYDDDDDEEAVQEEVPIKQKRKPDKRSGEQNLGDYGTWESTPNSYYEDIPQSQEDFEATEQLTDAENQMNVNAALALNIFNQVLTKYPESVRGLYGKAQCLDRLAEQKRSNSLLMEAIQAYWHIINQKNVPNNLFIATGERCIDRMRFIGHYSRAVDVHKLLIDRYPRNVTLRNQLAVTYLTINRINEARALLQKTLDLWPNDGFALVHYGFILKVNDNDLNGAIKYLTKGLETKEAGVVDGRFYFHLGDALTRLGRRQEADAVYTQGVEMGVFLSKYQRSLYNVNRLTSRAWWSKDQMGHYKRFCDLLEENYEAVREEGLQALNGLGKFQDESENLRDSGDWKQFELYARGQRNAQNCKRCPFTCKLVESFPDAVGCRRGQIKFSVMHPGTHVWPHCGPTNCRLRIHLGLKVPKNTFIRVADDVTSWTEGRVLIFDDSFEHEVWHNGSDFRLVLIVDVWHPELTVSEKRTLSAI